MKIEDIKNPEIKGQIQLAYLHGENSNQEGIDKVNQKMQDLISDSQLITVKENESFVKIPYGNDGDYVIPVFTDKQELEKGMEYFRLNDMKENKIPETASVKDFKKIKDNPNFLGLLINIATVSYIINIDF